MEFYGLLGEKLGHSLSPQIHKVILEKSNVEGAYKLFEIPKDKLENFTDSIKLLKIKGFNVTIPYKENIIKYLDYVSPEAQRIGAVNTVVLKENKLYGYNTDYFGIGIMLESKNIQLSEKIAVILGAGGACKAMLTYLLDNNIKKVYVVSRKPQEVNLKVIDKRVAIIDYKELEKVKGHIIVNSTPLGMYPKVEASAVNKDIIDKYSIVVDLIYNPLQTKFLKYAEELGKVTVGGLYMLVGQAIKAQEVFQGKPIDKDLISYIYNDLSVNFK